MHHEGGHCNFNLGDIGRIQGIYSDQFQTGDNGSMTATADRIPFQNGFKKAEIPTQILQQQRRIACLIQGPQPTSSLKTLLWP